MSVSQTTRLIRRLCATARELPGRVKDEVEAGLLLMDVHSSSSIALESVFLEVLTNYFKSKIEGLLGVDSSQVVDVHVHHDHWQDVCISSLTILLWN